MYSMVTKDDINELIRRCDATMDLLIEMGMAPNKQKQMTKTFSVKELCEHTGKSRATLNKYIKDLSIEPINKNAKAHPRFTLANLNSLREAFGTSPRRREGEPPFHALIQNYKGGVGKSVISVHASQKMAIEGHRVLIVDCDPQASATTSFGYIPDRDFTEANTIGPFLRGEQATLEYAVIDTYFEGVDLIPSCLPLYGSDLGLFIAMIQNAFETDDKSEYYKVLKEAVDTISNNYDIIIFDSPPTLGMSSLNLIQAADGLIIPSPPSMYDFSSTRQYLALIRDGMDADSLAGKQFAFLKVLANRVSSKSPKEKEFAAVMKDNFGRFMFNGTIQDAQSIKNAAAYFKTIYDVTSADRDDEDKPIRVEKNLYDAFDKVFGEMLTDIYNFWGREE